MGFGDFVKGAAGAIGDIAVTAATQNPVSQAAIQGANYLGEKFIEDQSETARRAPGLPQPEAGHGQMMPGQPGRNIRLTGENAMADVGEKYGENIQHKAEAIEGYANAAKFVLTHDPRTTASKIKTVGQTMWDNPDLVWEGVKQGAIEGGVAAAMDPTTYLGGGIALGAATGERVLARTAERTAARGVEEAAARTVTHTADELAGRTVARSADDVVAQMAKDAAAKAPAGLDEALTATARRGLATSSRLGRGIESIDTSDVNLRETLTGNPQGRLGRARTAYVESKMPGPQSSFPKQLLKDKLAGSPTMPTEGPGLAARQSVFRATQIGRRLAAPSKIRTAEQVGRFLYDPKAALTEHGGDWARSAANWAIEEHPEAVAAVGGAYAASQAMGAYNTFKTVKSALGIGGGGEEQQEGASEEAKPSTGPPLPEATAQVGLMQFRADQTHATRTSRRQPGRRTQLGTVTRDSTMPSAIGPSNWYGPQGGYDAGRGFQQRPTTPSGALPPLEQPTTRPRETAGI
jgi:hypothetical protein